MSLSQYIGQFKVTAGELGIARASCPNSVYSSNLIAGGRADDNALGYKEYQSPIVNDKKTAVEPDFYTQGTCNKGYVLFPSLGCQPDQGSLEKNLEYERIIEIKIKNQPRLKGDPVADFFYGGN
jgi:hypothetical protein